MAAPFFLRSNTAAAPIVFSQSHLAAASPSPTEPSLSSGLLNSNDQNSSSKLALQLPNCQICHLQKKKRTNQEKERNQKRADLKKGRKNRNFACIFSSFAGDGGYHRRCKKGDEEKTSQIHRSLRL